MSKFTPNTERYGREVIFLDRDGQPDGRSGTLTRIHSPFHYAVNGKVWEVGETDKFFEDEGQLYLQCPY